MFIPDSDFYPSRIPDPKTGTKERGERKICCHTFFCSHKFHKIVNYFIFEMLKKKIWANFQRIIELFTQKIVTKLSKIWVWDPGSGKNLFRIPDPVVKKAPDPGSGSATLQKTQSNQGAQQKKHTTGDITARGGTAAESTTAIRKRATTESTVARQRAVHRKPLLKRGSLLSGKR